MKDKTNKAVICYYLVIIIKYSSEKVEKSSVHVKSQMHIHLYQINLQMISTIKEF
jgi:hypothetical protein